MDEKTEACAVKPKITLSRKAKKNLFYYALVALPLLQFAIFYVYVNFNNILMAFKVYERVDDIAGGFTIISRWSGENFPYVINALADKSFMFKNSITMFLVATFIEYPLALIFSFYIYKKYPASKLFKFVLFMPQIISSIVFGLLFKYIVNDVYLTIFPDGVTGGLLGQSDTTTGWAVIVFYNVWISFGVNVLLFSGGMSGIDESLVEAAEIDGVNNVQEFVRITLPLIYDTIVSLFIITLASIFTNQMNLFTLYGAHARDYSSLGYFMYLQAQASDIISKDPDLYFSYSQLAAMGVMLTLICVPITIGVKKLMTKYGPSEE